MILLQSSHATITCRKYNRRVQRLSREKKTQIVTDESAIAGIEGRVLADRCDPFVLEGRVLLLRTVKLCFSVQGRIKSEKTRILTQENDAQKCGCPRARTPPPSQVDGVV